MSEERKRRTAAGPCEAEEVWFLMTDRFYRTLNNQGQRAAAALAAKAFDAMAPSGESRTYTAAPAPESPAARGSGGENTMNYAVKALGGGRIEAYALRFGSPQEPDRSFERDYFTPNTDLMLSAWGWPRPILYEHQAEQVGEWHGATKDNVGVKLHGQLDTAHPRYGALAQDIAAGRYFLSSDSAPHLVKRRAQPNGTNELTRWALLTASLTKSPAEHRLLPVATVKALSLKAGARHNASDMEMLQQMHDHSVALGAACAPAGKAMTTADKQRAARIMRELEMLEEDIAHKIECELDELEEGL